MNPFTWPYFSRPTIVGVLPDRNDVPPAVKAAGAVAGVFVVSALLTRMLGGKRRHAR